MEEEPANYSVGIVKVAAVFLIGILILSGIDSGVGVHSNNAILSFDNQPADGDTITINGYILEFDSGDGVVSGHIPVTIGATLTETIANLGTAIGGI